MKKLLIISLLVLFKTMLFSQNVDSCIQLSNKLLNHFLAEQPDSIYSHFSAKVKEKMGYKEFVKGTSNFRKYFGEFQEQKPSKITMLDDRLTIITPLIFKQSAVDYKISFSEKYEVEGFLFSPASSGDSGNFPVYADTTKFTEIDTYIQCGDFKLPAKLTIPNNMTHFPIVVLVHGSGPNDMDETLGPNKVFRDIAYGLSTKGIAVLRYDKRSHSYPMKMTANRPLDLENEVLEDADAAIKLACTVQGVNPEKVFVLGHSLGAWLAPEIARRNPALAGIIMAAAPSREMEDLILAQMNYIYALDGINKVDESNLKKLQKQVDLVKSGNYNESTSQYDLPLNLPASYWKSMKSYKFTEIAKALTMPVLIMQGTKDYQITYMEDFKGWKKLLKKNKNVSFMPFKGLNHLFMQSPAKELSTPEEYDTSGNVDIKVIEAVSSWIKTK